MVNDNAYGLRVANTLFTNIIGTGIQYNDAANLSTYSYVNSIESCDFSTITTGVDVQGINALLVSNTVFQDCNKGFYANPIAAGTGAFNMSFETCWFERNTVYDIQLSSNSSYWCEASIKNCQFAGFVPIGQAHIDLGSRSRISIEGICGGNTTIVSGSGGATAILIRAVNFVQSGSFGWFVFSSTGVLTAGALTADTVTTEAITSQSFKSLSGVFGSPTSGSTVTLTTLPNVNDGTWLVTGVLSGTGNASACSCVGIITTQGTSSVYSAIKTASTLTLSVSGLSFQGNQTTGGIYSISWSITKIG